MGTLTIREGLDALGEYVSQAQLANLKELGREIEDGGERRLYTVQAILRLLGDRWSALILLVLATGRLRHAELRRILHAISHERLISQRMLTLKLRDFERHGLVERRITKAARPAVSYALTPIGRDLARHTRTLIDWIDEFPPE